MWHRIECSGEMLWTLYWVFVDEVYNHQLLKKNFAALSHFYTCSPKLVFSLSKIWTCYYKLFWKLLLIIRIGFIHLFTADSIVNTWAWMYYRRCGRPSRSTWATNSCVFVVCCWCRCGNWSTYWIFVNVAQIVTVSCIELSFHFFCFVPHTLLRSLRRVRRLVISLVTANQKRWKGR
jgi:hypothetical protein